ncbi:OPT oligopeptide transporter [Cordyceps javanica]|uniref:OPT oligopeptide transporter n=1 Tax=Cordyceps javanica TaxID=43265 RepID=A0A545VEQ2_9HYPO|nr:OPT oligopeptide transporter [Cordyceps javanica]TQW11391.1 OPT oligopeptide transporter [Cordyceps javanica]
MKDARRPPSLAKDNSETTGRTTVPLALVSHTTAVQVQDQPDANLDNSVALETPVAATAPLPHHSTVASSSHQRQPGRQQPDPSTPPSHDHVDALSSPSQHARTVWPAESIAEADPDSGSELELTDFDMVKKKKSFRLDRRPLAHQDATTYGAVNLSPYQSQSPSEADSEEYRRRPSYARDTSRSKRSAISRSSSRVSEDLDGAILVSGVEGRFGPAETPLVDTFSNGKPDDSDIDEEDVFSIQDDTSTVEDEDENSPHEAVRASVPPTDDTTLSINTPRMWCLSVLFSILGSSTNLFFSLRYPSVAITPVIALLLVHPLGLFWDVVLKRSYDPEETFVDGVRDSAVPDENEPPARRTKTLRSWRQWFAQGRWNEKEHTCVYVSSNVAFGFAFATDVIVEQTQFYNQSAPIAYQLLLTISTQILGYGFAGMARRFLVRPSGMIWPGTLMSAAMFSTLHKQDNKPANGWTISRWNFFYIVWIGAFLFYFLPGLLMPALSYFSVITWFAPKNVVIANLFGVTSGLGLFPLTFDWAQITYVGSPLLVPFWAAVNVVAGLVVVMWFIAPLCYYANVLYSSYMPILSTAVFDNTGKVYDVSRILTSDFLFDRDAYRNYSRVFLPVTYMLSYGVQFAGLAALLTHTLCWHGSDIWHTWKRALAEAREESSVSYEAISGTPTETGDAEPDPLSRHDSHGNRSTHSGYDDLLSREDIHSRLMKRYKDAPLSWYMLTFLSMTAVGIFIVEYYPIHLPWYGLLLALAIGAIFFIPNGIIMAVTNQHSSIYLICQLICGVVFPGRPIANMVFVTYGYISSAQGIKFAADLKLGHYMKIPPRIMFMVQVVATFVSSVTQIGVLNWMFVNVRGICTAEAVNGFTCPIARVHFNGSILWGVVGPGEFFGPGAIYRALVWCFPLGALLPIPLWLYSRRRRTSFIRKVNLPVIFGAMAWIPPATGLNFSVWALVCYVFNYVIKRRAGAWWAKYTMTLSAALDSGLAFGIVVVFFGFIYPGWMANFHWWGTEVYKQGCDWQACSYKTVPDGQHFGPPDW